MASVGLWWSPGSDEAAEADSTGESFVADAAAAAVVGVALG